MKKIKCPFCDEIFTAEDGMISHVEDDHSDSIPKGFSTSQYVYYMRTGKTHGSCVVCKSNTTWNETTHKYNRFCNKIKCKNTYREMFKKRMIGKYGKVTLLNDPEQQRVMLSHRHISGEYTWSDGTVKTYTGTYELEFLKLLDTFMMFDSADVMTPSPHTYYYMYEGEKKFYIPDVYIPSLNLEVEIKQGGSNPNMKPNMVKIDKVKENLKDAVMKSQKKVNYIKVVDKNYDNFIQYLFDEKNKIIESSDTKISNIITEAMSDIQDLSDRVSLQEISSVDKSVKLYPVYIVLFSNDTEFGKIIRKVTGSNYSHATISLDPSLNNMYSFSDIPYSRLKINSDGFVRESLWSPMYQKNRFFTIMVTFVDAKGKSIIEEKINYFKDNYTNYKYNTLGLIEYYLKFKNTKNHNEHKKMKWFCSEFVAGMLNAADVDGFTNVLQSPQDLKNKSGQNIIVLKDFTIKTFSERELKTLTDKAEAEFRKNNYVIEESCISDVDLDMVPTLELNLKSLLPIKKKEYDEYLVTGYTSFVDWKLLYDKYMAYFSQSDENIRFDLFELILRKYLIPLHTDARNVTNNIINELERIYKNIHASVLHTIDVDNGIITAISGNSTKHVDYPSLTEK